MMLKRLMFMLVALLLTVSSALAQAIAPRCRVCGRKLTECPYKGNHAKKQSEGKKPAEKKKPKKKAPKKKLSHEAEPVKQSAATPPSATPEINPGDIVLFGSFFALNPVVRPQVAGFLEYAKNHGAILYYDINFRASHQNEIMKITPNLIENLEYADFVRGSHEDFGILYKKPEADKVYNAEISFYCKKFICTQGAEPVEVRAENGFAKSYPSEKMKPVSTIGAGDNFNAGFVFGLIKDGITREDIDRGLSEAQWDSLLKSAQEFSTECCKDIYNYVSKDFGEQKKKEL